MYAGQPEGQDDFKEILLKIWYRLFILFGGSAASGVVIAYPTRTNNFVAVPALTTATIPAGAKGWTITFLTGTGTWGGAAVAAGFSDSDPGTTANALNYATAAASTAVVRYGS